MSLASYPYYCSLKIRITVLLGFSGYTTAQLIHHPYFLHSQTFASKISRDKNSSLSQHYVLHRHKMMGLLDPSIKDKASLPRYPYTFLGPLIRSWCKDISSFQASSEQIYQLPSVPWQCALQALAPHVTLILSQTLPLGKVTGVDEAVTSATETHLKLFLTCLCKH